ncbi:MAG: malonic semialdehyde reductase [Rhodospirillaceae bacterium]|nr:malonic semialdehyde reductase [Rhodospirillaceae bacterium]|tara:strand:+ start:10698 stop:11282 length:585 start_codon:yes stop_codon:yes gene_type:complete
MTADSDMLDVIFNEGRTYDAFLDKPVPESLLQEAYDLAKMAPTSANCQPMRILFLSTQEAKDRLGPALSSTNREKTVKAPVVAVIAHDLAFYENLPKLYRIPGAEKWFMGQDGLIEETAFRNGALQGAYFMLAARAVGLGVGPMSGFDNGAVDAEFFSDSSWRSNFVCNIGYGDDGAVPDRDPRLDFAEACKVL